MSSADLGKRKHGIPDVVFQHIDKYVDSLAPQIQPRIASEIEVFQQTTIDSLDEQIISAFRSLFNKDDAGHGSRSLDPTPPDAYGIKSLPFADEIGRLTRSISMVADEANDDLREILDITEGKGYSTQTRGGHGDSFSQGARGFLSAAVDAVAEHSRQGSGSCGGQQLALDGLIGVLSSRVKEVSRKPEEKARVISPEIKEKIGVILSKQHAPIAEQFTRIALDHIKRWLRGNTSTRDIGDGAKGEIKDEIQGLVTGIAGMFGHKKQSDGNARGLDRNADDGGNTGGFSGVISNKLSTGLAKVHREVRLEFRNVLGGIEKQLFEALPDEVQGPLEKILGGNPFEPELDSSTSRGLGDDIKTKLVGKIRQLVRKVQESLRESILSIVNGGHRKFERESWVFVQNTVETKVQKYLPDVRIRVPDDIGNEGVSVGAPQIPSGMQQPVISSHHGSDQALSQPQYSGDPPMHHSQHPPSYDQDASQTPLSHSYPQYTNTNTGPSQYQPPNDYRPHDPYQSYSQHQNYEQYPPQS